MNSSVLTDPLPDRATTTDTVIARLRADIRSGQIPPGSRLRQKQVADSLGVSTTPVREAFSALEREGLLISIPHRGVVVFNPTIRDLHETYEIRIPLEALATELAVPNFTPADLAALKDLLDRMGEVTDDDIAYSKLNREFHASIYRAADRPKLFALISDLRDASTAYMRVFASYAPSAAETQHDHTAIYEACAARAPRRAAKAMTAHLKHTVEEVTVRLEALGDAGPL